MIDNSTYIYFQESLQALGLERGATFDDVKVAYRSLAKKWHPDLFAINPEGRAGAEEKMKEINTVYRWLAANRTLFGVDWENVHQEAEAEPVSPTPAHSSSVPARANPPRNRKGSSGIIWAFILALNALNIAASQVDPKGSIAIPIALGGSLFLLMIIFLVRGIFMKH